MAWLMAKMDPLWATGAMTFMVLGVCMIASGIADIRRGKYTDRWFQFARDRHPAIFWSGNIAKIAIGLGLVGVGIGFLVDPR
jgi:hypothetical protein